MPLLTQIRGVKFDLNKPIQLEIQNRSVFQMLQQHKELCLLSKQANGKCCKGKKKNKKTTGESTTSQCPHTCNPVHDCYAAQEFWFHLFRWAKRKRLCTSLPLFLGQNFHSSLRGKKLIFLPQLRKLVSGNSFILEELKMDLHASERQDRDPCPPTSAMNMPNRAVQQEPKPHCLHMQSPALLPDSIIVTFHCN